MGFVEIFNRMVGFVLGGREMIGVDFDRDEYRGWYL